MFDRRPELDENKRDQVKWEFVVFINIQRRAYACVGPGKDKPCPTNWIGKSEGGAIKRCPACKKAFDRVNRNFHKRKRNRVANARKRELTRRTS